jgi:hypothetical protein
LHDDRRPASAGRFLLAGLISGKDKKKPVATQRWKRIVQADRLREKGCHLAVMALSREKLSSTHLEGGMTGTKAVFHDPL